MSIFDEKVIKWGILQQEFGEELILSNNKLILSKKEKIIENIENQESAHKKNKKDYDFVDVNSLEDLKKQIQEFEGLEIKNTATNMVFGNGNINSKIMFIGEAPGAEEDAQGIPFVGQSGQLLSKMLEAIDLTRDDVYITNVVNWRPPGNRPPTQNEIDLCMPFLKKHIELISPKIIVLLGATAMRAVLQINTGLSKSRGFWHYYNTNNNKKIKTMVTFHPSYLLRSPGQKAFAWQDFMMLMDEINGRDE